MGANLSHVTVTCNYGLVHTFTGILITVFSPSVIYIMYNIYILYMKTLKRCQEHAKPIGGDITLTVKPGWPIRSLIISSARLKTANVISERRTL